MTEQGYLRIEEAGGLIIASDWPAIAKLMAKLSKASSLVRGVEQDGRNKDQNYQFVSYQEVASAVRHALSDAGLAFMVNHTDREDSTGQSKSGATYSKVKLTGTLTFADGETGAMWSIHAWGDGMDYADKALSKAITALVKYPLMRIFLLSSRDDVEPDQEDVPNGNGHKIAPQAKPAPAQPETKPQAIPAAIPEESPWMAEEPATPLTDGHGKGKPGEPAPTQPKGNVGWGAWGPSRQNKFWAEAKRIGLDDATVHTEFKVASMTEYQGSNDKAVLILHLLEFGFAQALGLDEIHKALGIRFMDDFGGNSAMGHMLINKYLATVGQKETVNG
jgi:hypothetical protein